jgi:hypothetical protein
MLRDGRYAAWFRTSHGEGTCNVHLAGGRIAGGDSFFSYSGSYEVENDYFTAVLATRRYAPGPPTVFGLDEVEIKLSGKINGITAACTGIVEQVPGVTLEATLFLGDDSPPDRKRAMRNPDAGKPPKLARNPFARGLSTI